MSAIACGGDYSVATAAETGTVFGWGNNASGQLGRAPVEEGTDGAGGGAKVVVMKTTRRIIRLQNSLQNSCDVPRPVPGVFDRDRRGGEDVDDEQGVYHGREDFGSSDEEDLEEWSEEAGGAALRCAEVFSLFTGLLEKEEESNEDVERLLHLTLEKFAGKILASERDWGKKLTKLSLVSDNLKAAAKVRRKSAKTCNCDSVLM